MKLPPEYVIVPAGLVYSDLPASIQRTAERIYGLAWQSHRASGPDQPLSATVGLEELCDVCDLSRRQLFSHLRILVNRGVLRYTYSRTAGIYVFQLPPRSHWSHVLDPPQNSAENRTVPTIHVVVPDPELGFVDQREQQPCSCIEGGCGGEAGECGNPHSDLAEELIGLGIGASVAARLAADYPHRIPGQIAHYEWARDRGRAEDPGWLVRAIEENYYLPRDVERRLKQGDGRRYIMGDYAEFIQH